MKKIKSKITKYTKITITIDKEEALSILRSKYPDIPLNEDCVSLLHIESAEGEVVGIEVEYDINS